MYIVSQDRDFHVKYEGAYTETLANPWICRIVAINSEGKKLILGFYRLERMREIMCDLATCFEKNCSVYWMPAE